MTQPAYFTTTIPINGQDVSIRIVRFDYETREAFNRDFSKVQTIRHRQQALDRFAMVQAGMVTEPEGIEPDPEGDEPKEDRQARLARNATRQRVFEDNRTLAVALRELEETSAQRERRTALQAEHDVFATRFVKDAFARFVSVDPDCTVLDDAGERVQTGSELLSAFTSRELHATVLFQILLQNSLSADLKKKLASRSGSAPSSLGSSEPSQTASGAVPAQTAANVSPEASAGLVGAAEAP